ncbi:MAG: hypothetical protein ACO1RA_02125 [Planctomycetaceae bacterium]
MAKPTFLNRFTACLTILAIALGVVVIGNSALAQTKGSKRVRRVQLPKLATDTDVFFNDAFKEALVGERPADLGKSAAVVKSSPGGNAGTPAATSGGGGGAGWSSVISSQAIEDEIKALKLKVDAAITTPSEFKGKGYRLVRRDFSMLAMLFAITGEYEGDVRWKKSAPGARDTFARTAANAKVGTDQVFAEAKLRKTELADLVGGSDPFGGKEAEVKATWNTVCDRAPLMQYLEDVYEPSLKPNLNDKGQFTANIDKVAHEAEVFAAIAAAIAKEGMEDADSAEYKAFCQTLEKASRDIVEACKVKNYEAASSAGTVIGKACTECHELFRSN